MTSLKSERKTRKTNANQTLEPWCENKGDKIEMSVSGDEALNMSLFKRRLTLTSMKSY